MRLLNIISLADVDTLADILADDGFFDYSDSINTVAGLQTGFPIFPNKTAFVAHQNTAPDNLPLVIVEVGPWNCDQITLIWSTTFTKVPGGTPLPVRGITVLESVYNKGDNKHEMQNIKVEFNSMNYFIGYDNSNHVPLLHVLR